MNYDFMEDEIQILKEEYQKLKMSQRQFDELKRKMEEANMENKKVSKKRGMMKLTAAAAVLAGAFLILPNTSATIAYAMEQIPILGQLVQVVTFRDYEYETDRNSADIQVPEIKLEEQAKDSEVQEKLENSVGEINEEIQNITNQLVEEFESSLEEQEGYQNVSVTSEVLATTEEYFTLKLICYQGAGSGYQWNYYYTIDLGTGERLQLKDIFKDGADYITPISENIKMQMKEQMAADESVVYWLDQEVEEWNFQSITDETSFYMNEKGNVVIGFNEGDVGPMSMGDVEFEIPSEVFEDILK